MSSTSSSTVESPSQTPSEGELDEAALREAMETSEGVRRLGRMLGVRSIARNLKTEDDAIARDMLNQETALGDCQPRPPASEQPMDLMAARDIHITLAPKEAPKQEVNTAKPAEPTAPVPAPTPAAPPATSSGLSTLAKAGIAAAILGSGGIGASIPFLLNLVKAPVQNTTVLDPSSFDLQLVPNEETK